jgi:hypothetical protein
MAIVPSANQSPFEHLRQVDDGGREFWSARDLCPVMGYVEWRKFEDAIGRARAACENTGSIVGDHFVGADKVTEGGRWGTQRVSDHRLTRYAAYLVAMNGDPRKTEIAEAQTYFAARTREAELIATGAIPAARPAPLAIEAAAVARAHVEVFGLALQMGAADESYVRGRVQTLLARMIGEEPQLDPASITITADEYLDGKVGGRELMSARTRLGKAVAQLYRQRYGKDPQKIERYIDGVHRKVSVYTRRDLDLFDAAWAEVKSRYAVVTP